MRERGEKGSLKRGEKGKREKGEKSEELKSHIIRGGTASPRGAAPTAAANSGPELGNEALSVMEPQDPGCARRTIR